MIRFLVFILIIPCLLIGQTEPIEKIEVEPDPIVQDAFDAVSGKMNDVKAMFKGTLDNGLKVGYEVKLGKAFSFNPQISLGAGIGGVVGPGFNIDLNVQSTLGLRYFFQHKDRINAGLQGNNLNGLYLELGSDFSLFNSGIFGGLGDFGYLKIGSQSRVFKSGLVDIGLSLSYSPETKNINLSTGFDLGIAKSKNYELQEFENNKCAIVNCYEENRTLVKIPANNLVNINLSQSNRLIGFVPTLVFEHKISKVSLSMTHRFAASMAAQELSIPNMITSSSFNSFYELGIKWIMGKRRQVIKGETANNLSGVYLGPIASIGYQRGKPFTQQKYEGSYFTAGFRLGYQTRLLKNLYIDFQMGGSYKEFIELEDPDKFFNLIISDRATIIPNFDFSVGYAF